MAEKEKKVGFVRSVFNEMKLVTWPSKKQLRKDTLVVIESSIIFAALFAVMDFGISKGIGLLIKK
ncbi:preprotein translocase subunit SecE [Enterococcus timonensis]|uniref:preprotein translocase subunit SecE n=1 Tax=Enterococcus timonensis TaxID=1852364 RepID=UPI0008D9F65B|nr:preprotein translocase subunit SecE [Enterococcus timonensis]